MKRILLLFLCAATVVGATVWVWQRRAQSARQAALERAKAERAAELARLQNQQGRTLAPIILPVPEPDSPEARRQSKTNLASTEPTNSIPQESTPQDPAALAQALLAGSKKAWQDPIARMALTFVGDDDVAEAIWVRAINNPDLPPKERQDLIEDLNEEGFPDPKHPGPNDLPLIFSRLALIEEHAPDAMDDVNAAAFMEAYKDLLNMAAKVMQQ